MPYEYRRFYIDGRWVEPLQGRELAVINPALEQPAGVISLGAAGDIDRAVAAAGRVARRIRAGRVTINGAPGDKSTPFGGFKQSGNGREWGEYGLREFLEVKAVLGAEPA